MGKKDDYKKGMADAMEGYTAFGEKQEAAIEYLAEQEGQTADKVKQIGDKVGQVVDYISDQEKVNLYKLNSPIDVADLDDNDQRLLLAILYQLSTQEPPTEAQQGYIRSIQQYLKIPNPQSEVDLAVVENVADISAQKAILQAILEFFRLGSHPETFTDEQENFLNCFQLNLRTRNEISEHINAIVTAVGLSGLTEKYGFNPVIAPSGEDVAEPSVDNEEILDEPIPDISEFEEITLDGIIHITPEEVLSYKYKIIHFHGVINCEGTLEFDTCVLHYGEMEDETVEIDLAETAALSMNKCTIENHSYDDNNSLICAECLEDFIEFIGCEFINCCHFLKCNSTVLIEQCRIINPGDALVCLYGSEKQVQISKCEFYFSEKPSFFPEQRQGDIIRSFGSLWFESCLVQGDLKISSAEEAESIASKGSSYSFLSCGWSEYIHIEYSTFRGINGEIVEGNSIDISSSIFEHCAKISTHGGCINISDCRFAHCADIACNLAPGSEILDSQFNYCYNNLISSSYGGDLTIRYCEFNNIEVSRFRDVLSFYSSKKDFTHSTVDLCRFNGIALGDYEFLIAGNVFEKVSGCVVTVSKCTFVNCTTERNSGKIIKEYGTYYGPFSTKKEIHTAHILDCKGLDKVNPDNRQNKDIIIKAKDKKGLSIGLNIAGGIIAGIPGVIASNAINKMLKDDDIHIE